MKKHISLLMAITTFLCTTAEKNINGNIIVDGGQRDYIIHLPLNYKAGKKIPLVLIFHGGGGNYKQTQGYMEMDAIADKENFICVYPNGINKQWNDGREFKADIAAHDDVKFISLLLDTLFKSYCADKGRVFATGISNGAFFSIYLSYKLSNRLLAIAPVCGSIPEKIFEEFAPSSPVSVLLMNGTKDPLVPFEGGKVGGRFLGNRGNCTSTDKTIEKYISINHTSTSPVIKAMPDTDGDDGCTAVQYTYAGGKNKTSVVLMKITNGGHTLPGATQYLPKFLIGKVCRDFKGNEMIWNFFKACETRN